MTTTSLASIFWSSLCLISILGTATCSQAQDKDTLDTKVVGEGNVITLSWDKKHPWDADLIAHGVSLIAEYKTKSNGVVAQKLQTAAPPPGTGNRYIHFRLPDSLTAAPQGAVCLYFQLANQKLLPVRKPGAQVLDSVRMRYQPWETVVVQNSQEKSRENEVAALKKALDQKSSEIALGEKALKDKGWPSADACEKIPVPQFTSGKRPFDVIDPPKQEQVARRICVSRIKWAGDLMDRAFQKGLKDKPDAEKQSTYSELALAWVMSSPDELAAILQAPKLDASDPNFKQRQQQLRQFRTDWTRWAPEAENYTPELGGKTDLDFLTYQSFLAESCKKDPTTCAKLVSLIANHSRNPAHIPPMPLPPDEMVLGYVGGALEAYSRCVVDDQKELKTKYDAWDQMQRNAPALNEEAHKELVTSCQRQFTTMDRLRADMASLQEQLQKASQVPDTSASAANTGSQALNSSACQRPQ